MNLNQFIVILLARAKLVLGVAFTVILITLIVSLVMPKTYTATTSLVINYKGVDPVTGLSMPAQLMPGYMTTQIDIITSRNVALKVVDQFKFSENPAAKEQFTESTGGKGDIRSWFADRLAAGLEAKPSRESSVIEISYKGADPDFVATMANAFADAYQQTNIQLRAEPSQKASEFLEEKTKALRAKLEEANSRMSKYQQEKGLTSVMGNLDVESARLNELSSQLVAAQSQRFDSASRKFGASGNGDASPDIASNPIVQGLKIDITRAETKFSELSKRLGASHPQYQAAQTELNALKNQLREQTQKASNTIGGSAAISQRLENDLKNAVAAQKERVLELNRSRDELSVLQRDVENAQHAVDSASQRLTQTTMEGSVNQADIAVLNPAMAPSTHSGPRIKFNLAIATVLGFALGIFSGLVIEFFDQRLRRKEDLSNCLQAPVLAVLGIKKPNNMFKLYKNYYHRILKVA